MNAGLAKLQVWSHSLRNKKGNTPSGSLLTCQPVEAPWPGMMLPLKAALVTILVTSYLGHVTDLRPDGQPQAHPKARQAVAVKHLAVQRR